MNVAHLRAKKYSAFLFIFLICAVFLGCEDPGSVGGSFTDTDTEIVDTTFSLNTFDAQSTSSFSGELDFFSAGQFDDPAFGNINVTGLVRPSLVSTSDTMEAGATMKLELIIDTDNIYGDTAQTAQFDLVELDQLWRRESWKIDDQVQLLNQAPVGSFSVGKEDSLVIPLADAWVDKYRSFVLNESASRDSVYRIQFSGLAIVPTNTAKIIPISAMDTRFIVENPNEDTLRVISRDWAHSVERTNQPAQGNSIPIHSTLEKVINFDVGLTREDLGTINISKVELVLFQNNQELFNALNQVSGTSVRPDIESASLHLVEPEDLPTALDPGIPISSAEIDQSDGEYRFIITNFVNSVILDGVDPQFKFFITIGSNDGIIRSTLFHSNQAPEEKRPRINVTFVEKEGNSN